MQLIIENVQSRQKPLSEEHARFYAASVILGLEYMQLRSMMWRQALAMMQTSLHFCHERLRYR